jgi:transcriptional regulator with PAS, ATPase and Fis domain
MDFSIGNVRELENIIEHAFACTKGTVITENKLPFYLRQTTPAPTPHGEDKNGHLDDEALHIRQTLQQSHWNRSLARKNWASAAPRSGAACASWIC